MIDTMKRGESPVNARRAIGRAPDPLDWAALVRRGDRSPIVARFARSLLADLVDMLGASPSCAELDALEVEHCHSLTWPPPRENLLRNL